MRAAVHMNDAIASARMIVLHIDSHRFGRLNDLHHGSLSKKRIEWQEWHRHAQASRRLCDRLGIVVDSRANAQTRRATRRAPASTSRSLRGGHQRRDFPVRGIDDHRRALAGLQYGIEDRVICSADVLSSVSRAGIASWIVFLL